MIWRDRVTYKEQWTSRTLKTINRTLTIRNVGENYRRPIYSVSMRALNSLISTFPSLLVSASSIIALSSSSVRISPNLLIICRSSVFVMNPSLSRSMSLKASSTLSNSSIWPSFIKNREHTRSLDLSSHEGEELIEGDLVVVILVVLTDHLLDFIISRILTKRTKENLELFTIKASLVFAIKELEGLLVFADLQ